MDTMDSLYTCCDEPKRFERESSISDDEGLWLAVGCCCGHYGVGVGCARVDAANEAWVWFSMSRHMSMIDCGRLPPFQAHSWASAKVQADDAAFDRRMRDLLGDDYADENGGD